MKKIIIIIILSVVISNWSYLIAQKQGRKYIDSLLMELPIANEDTAKVNLLVNLSFQMYKIDPDSGIEYGLEGLWLAKRLGWEKGKAKIYNAIAVNFMVIGKNDEALKYYHKALNIYDKLGYEKGIAATLGNIGIIYYNQGNYDKALKNYQKALKQHKKLENEKNIASVLNNIANIYEAQGKADYALEFYFKALNINKRLGIQGGIALNYGCIAVLYADKNEFTSSIKYYQKSLKINRRLEDNRLIVYNLTNLSELYQKLGAREDSLSKQLRKKESVSTAVNHYRNSLRYGIEAEKIATKINLGEKLYGIYLTISSAYQRLGNYQVALSYYRKFHLAIQTVLSVESQEKITKLELQYKFEKEEREAETAAQKLADEKSYRNTVQYSGISILVIILFIGLIFIPKFNFPLTLVEALMFITFLLFYEFVLLFLEPWIDDFTSNIPIYKLAINLGIVVLFIPFHSLEKKLENKYLAK